MPFTLAGGAFFSSAGPAVAGGFLHGGALRGKPRRESSGGCGAIFGKTRAGICGIWDGFGGSWGGGLKFGRSFLTQLNVLHFKPRSTGKGTGGSLKGACPNSPGGAGSGGAFNGGPVPDAMSFGHKLQS